MQEFKQGKVRVLVATDVAARGLDIERLPNVVNYELPHVAEDYVHRIGRTARAGNKGQAVSLVCIDEHKLLDDIEKLLQTKIPRVSIEGFTPDPSIQAEPVSQARKPRGGGPRKPGAGRSRPGRNRGKGGKPGRPARKSRRA